MAIVWIRNSSSTAVWAATTAAGPAHSSRCQTPKSAGSRGKTWKAGSLWIECVAKSWRAATSTPATTGLAPRRSRCATASATKTSATVRARSAALRSELRWLCLQPSWPRLGASEHELLR
uniref:Secreted protein n=1 Tax=Macrostomum lignano TaxID=282301 RepID=A0A1I8HCM5_9PLAT